MLSLTATIRLTVRRCAERVRAARQPVRQTHSLAPTYLMRGAALAILQLRTKAGLTGRYARRWAIGYLAAMYARMCAHFRVLSCQPTSQYSCRPAWIGLRRSWLIC